ncbi:Sulfur oxidation protein SoxZ [hydrothermal vent metagenome]|uniref:Sulfur oxidation protein SoxZ n=1 Tax=hydrothermal vent metagenome TaxID=652676 RepID=A0A3B0YJI5_9ZZZZ
MSTIKIRAKAGDKVTKVSALIEHPMETGMRKNKKTGKKIPAHYIQEVVCELNGTVVLTALWGPAVSKRPFLQFKIEGAKKGDVIKLSWVDNKGEKDSAEAKIT